MTDGALKSDHVNYLIYRYLQEVGFEDSARALNRDWHRHPDFSDPEQLSFAPAVKPRDLVHIIQDGLCYDQLQASLIGHDRRFKLTSDNIDLTTARAAAKTTTLRQSPDDAAHKDEFPLPSAKRARQSNASDVIINGDAMEIDTRPDEEQDEASPTDQGREESEIEAEEEPIPVVLKSTTTQTEPRIEVKTDTVYWTVDDTLPRTILHASWCPSGPASDSILLAGESLCGLSNFVAQAEDGALLDSESAMHMTGDHIVTAAAWHPTGSRYVCAIKGPEQVDGLVSLKSRLVDVMPHGDQCEYTGWFDMVTMVLKYNRKGNLLLSASTNGEDSVVEIREITNDEYRTNVSAFEVVPGSILLDAEYVSDTSFVVVGKGLCSIYTWRPSAADGDAPTLVQDYTIKLPSNAEFDKVRFEEQVGIIVLAASDSGDIHTLKRDGESWGPGPEIVLPSATPVEIRAISFMPMDTTSPAVTNAPSTLVIATPGEHILLYNITARSAVLDETLTIGSGDSPLALAWDRPFDAENGPRLAAASDEAIRVWDFQGLRTPPTEVVTWKAAPAKWYQADENHLPDEEDLRTEPILAWDGSGERLMFAFGQRVAVISIAPDDAGG